MREIKKIWFRAYSQRLWIPVSLEGWTVTAASACGLVAIVLTNDLLARRPFRISHDWPFLAETFLLTAALLWITRGHIDRRH